MSSYRVTVAGATAEPVVLTGLSEEEMLSVTCAAIADMQEPECDIMRLEVRRDNERPVA